MRAMPIIRSRTGCFTCRRRKKKCNEEKPLCSGCRRNHLECTWPTETSNTLQSASRAKGTVSKPAAHVANRQRTVSLTEIPPDTMTTHQHQQHQQHQQRQLDHDPSTTRHRTHSYSSSESNHDLLLDTEMTLAPTPAAADTTIVSPVPAPVSPVSPLSPVSPIQQHAITANTANAYTTDDTAIQQASPSNALAVSTNVMNLADPSLFAISTPMSLLPNHGLESADLMSYYLTRTANSMGNGSTDVNPFIAKLVPLAFSNPLVLQLLLAQSASHRQSAESSAVGTEVAHHYYSDSLRMFRNVVAEYVAGKEENTLALTVGSLILSLTEVARGDVHGTIFDHLRASESMLNLLLTRPKSEIPDDLPDFLVEFAIHMTVTSMMSTDPKRAPPELSPTIQALARRLIAKGYVGQLSGCWLELLLLIPQVFHLGHRMMAGHPGTGRPAVPHQPDDIITFGLLQSQIMAYFPDPGVNPYSRLAGLVFKQGVLLYLWSILGTTPHEENGASNTAHVNLMASAVAEALALLAQFPATLRINTSLCWPLTVIGCCTTDRHVQQVLRERLQTMHTTIGLGNMKETLILLEHIWNKPPADVSPWKLSEVMQEHQVWISFA